jgi:hypothetical protein
MAHAHVATIEALRVNAVQLPHAQRQIALWRLDKQMVVIIHQAIGMTQPTETRHHFAKAGLKHHTVLIVKKDWIPSVAARSDVIDCTGEFKSK